MAIKDTHNEIPECIEDLEDVIDYLPNEEDVLDLKYMFENEDYEALKIKAQKLLSIIDTASNALGNIVYLSSEDVE